MLHRLKLSDRPPELFARFRVRDGDLQQPLHATGHLGGEAGRGDIESRVEHLARTAAACNDVLGGDLRIFQSDFIERPRDVLMFPIGVWAQVEDIPVYTVCDIMKDLPAYRNKAIIIVGRLSSTGEGAWLDQDCPDKLITNGYNWSTSVSLSYVVGQQPPPPSLPKPFRWNKALLSTKLAEVRRTTVLRTSPKYHYSDSWVAGSSPFAARVNRRKLTKHLNEAVDAVRRELWRQLNSQDRVTVKGTRWLWLRNPWNLSDHQNERLSTLVRWNTPLVRAWYLKEAFQLF